jgi:transcriptional regulator GlxA family with amidase domain
MRTRFLWLIVVLGLLATSLPAQTVAVDWVRGTDFTAFKTYAWETQRVYPVNDPIARAHFVDIIGSELGGKGLSAAGGTAKFDLIVVWNARVQQDLDDTTKQTVTIQVALVDPSNNRALWRASAFSPISGDDSRDAAIYQDLVHQMFQRYPPSE